MKLLKRLSLFLLVAALLVTMIPSAFAANSFTDVRSTDWFSDAVSYVQERGLMSGTSATHFSPNEPTTRAMLVTILYRVAGQPETTGQSSFADVLARDYFANAVAWASENNIVTGYSRTRFGSNDPVSREQIATLLWRYAGSPSAGSAQNFADRNQISDYAADAVNWARANGIVNGRPGNRFDPKANATRAEVATILRNFLSQQSNPDTPETPTTTSSKTLVVYFSASGSTKAVAETIADELDADIFELVPTQPYSSDDLNWTVSGSRVNREHDDESLRDIALTQTTPANWDEYDTVFIGYPIWWGIAAWPVNNFVKDNDFSGKTVIPFATSSSSGMGQSGTLLEEMANGGTWQSGQRFSSGASSSTVRDWAAALGL